MRLKSFLDSICRLTTIACNNYYGQISGRFERKTVLALKDIALQPFLVQKFILNVMFGHLIFVMNSYFSYARTLQLLGIIICSFIFVAPHNTTSASFRLFLFVIFDQPCEPTLLDQLMNQSSPRWIQYTQAELRQVRAELQHRNDEEQAIRRIQQAQLDSLQAQIRDHGQQQSEISEQVAEIANAIAELYQQLGLLRQTVNHAMNDVLRYFDSPPVVNPTQITATQPEFHRFTHPSQFHPSVVAWYFVSEKTSHMLRF